MKEQKQTINYTELQINYSNHKNINFAAILLLHNNIIVQLYYYYGEEVLL